MFRDKGIRLVILMAILTGMRSGELFGLFWEHIDFQSNVIHVKQALCWKYGKHIQPVGWKKGDDLFD
jgi:integrase